MNIGSLDGDFTNLTINATGGNAASGAMGVGGGGYVGINVCQEVTSGNHSSLAAGVSNTHGTGGVTNGAANGNTDVVKFNDPNSNSYDLWQCKQLPQLN